MRSANLDSNVPGLINRVAGTLYMTSRLDVVNFCFAMTFQEEPSTSEHSEMVVSAVDRLTSDEDLIADGSRVYSLPTISGKHKDLKTISPDTVSHIYKTSPYTMVQPT